MARPVWVGDAFAGVMVVVSLYCVARLVAARRWRRANQADVSTAHAVMGVGMAAMLVPRLDPLSAPAWEAVFGVMALWFLGRATRSAVARRRHPTAGDAGHDLSHSLIHLFMAGAMVYMEWLAGGVPGAATVATMAMGAAGGPAARYAALTLAVVAVLFASAVRQLDAITSRPAPAAASAVVTSAGGAAPADVAPVEVAPAGEPPAASHPLAPALSPGTLSPGTLSPLAPGLECACHVSMCVTMAYMLVLML